MSEDSYVIVALPKADSRLPNTTDDPSHITLAYIEADETGLVEEALVQVASEIAMSTGPFSADTAGRGWLGKDDAAVLFLEADELSALHDRTMSNPYVSITESFPTWIPHLTLGYGDEFDLEAQEVPRSVEFDRIGVWGPTGKAEFQLTGDFDQMWSYLDNSANMVTMASASPVTATAGQFDATLHPRGGDGKFIEKWGIVKWLKNGKWTYGKVVSITADPSDTNHKSAVIEVEPSNLIGEPTGGAATTMKARKVYSAPKPVAHLSINSPKSKKIGGQAGSNPGGLYSIPVVGNETESAKWYVKKAKTKDHGANEWLANLLYADAGVAVPAVQYDPTEGNIYSPITAGKHDMLDQIASKNEPWLDAVRRNFVVDAWLANHDVFGLAQDNLLTDEHGVPWRIDNGGALLFRAQGSKKTDFGDKVAELDTFPIHQKKMYGNDVLTDEQKLDGATRVLAISPDEIKNRVAQVGLPKSLADTLIARRAYIANYYGMPLPESIAHPDAEIGTDAPTFDPADIVEGNGKGRDWFPLPLSIGMLVLKPGDTVQFPDGTQSKYGYTPNGEILSAIERANQLIGWQTKHGISAEMMVHGQAGVAGRPVDSNLYTAAELAGISWQRGDHVQQVTSAGYGIKYSVLWFNQKNGGMLVQPVTGEGIAPEPPFIIDTNKAEAAGQMFRTFRWDKPKANLDEEFSSVAVVPEPEPVPDLTPAEPVAVDTPALSGMSIVRGAYTYHEAADHSGWYQVDPDTGQLDTSFLYPQESMKGNGDGGWFTYDDGTKSWVPDNATGKPGVKGPEPVIDNSSDTVLLPEPVSEQVLAPITDQLNEVADAAAQLSETISQASVAMAEIKEALVEPLPDGDGKPAIAKIAKTGKGMVIGDNTEAAPGDKLFSKVDNKWYVYTKAKGPYAVVTDPDSDTPEKLLQKKASTLVNPSKEPIAIEGDADVPKSANGKVPSVGQLAEAKDGHKGKITMISPDGKFVFITDDSGVKKRKSIGTVTILDDGSLPAPVEEETNAKVVPTSILISPKEFQVGQKVTVDGNIWYDVIATTDSDVTLHIAQYGTSTTIPLNNESGSAKSWTVAAAEPPSDLPETTGEFKTFYDLLPTLKVGDKISEHGDAPWFTITQIKDHEVILNDGNTIEPWQIHELGDLTFTVDPAPVDMAPAGQETPLPTAPVVETPAVDVPAGMKLTGKTWTTGGGTFHQLDTGDWLQENDGTFGSNPISPQAMQVAWKMPDDVAALSTAKTFTPPNDMGGDFVQNPDGTWSLHLSTGAVSAPLSPQIMVKEFGPYGATLVDINGDAGTSIKTWQMPDGSQVIQYGDGSLSDEGWDSLPDQTGGWGDATPVAVTTPEVAPVVVPDGADGELPPPPADSPVGTLKPGQKVWHIQNVGWLTSDAKTPGENDSFFFVNDVNKSNPVDAAEFNMWAQLNGVTAYQKPYSEPPLDQMPTGFKPTPGQLVAHHFGSNHWFVKTGPDIWYLVNPYSGTYGDGFTYTDEEIDGYDLYQTHIGGYDLYQTPAGEPALPTLDPAELPAGVAIKPGSKIATLTTDQGSKSHLVQLDNGDWGHIHSQTGHYSENQAYTTEMLEGLAPEEIVSYSIYPGPVAEKTFSGYTPSTGDVIVENTPIANGTPIHWIKTASDSLWYKLEDGKITDHSVEQSAIEWALNETGINSEVVFGTVPWPSPEVSPAVAAPADTDYKVPLVSSIVDAMTLQTSNGDQALPKTAKDKLLALGHLPAGHSAWGTLSGRVFLLSNAGTWSQVGISGAIIPFSGTPSMGPNGALKKITVSGHHVTTLIDVPTPSPVDIPAATEPNVITGKLSWDDIEKLSLSTEYINGQSSVSAVTSSVKDKLAQLKPPTEPYTIWAGHGAVWLKGQSGTWYNVLHNGKSVSTSDEEPSVSLIKLNYGGSGGTVHAKLLTLNDFDFADGTEIPSGAGESFTGDSLAGQKLDSYLAKHNGEFGSNISHVLVGWISSSVDKETTAPANLVLFDDKAGKVWNVTLDGNLYPSPKEGLTLETLESVHQLKAVKLKTAPVLVAQKSVSELLDEKAEVLGAPKAGAMKKVTADKIITVPQTTTPIYAIYNGNYVDVPAGEYKSSGMITTSGGITFPASQAFFEPHLITDDESTNWLGKNKPDPADLLSWGGSATKDGYIPTIGLFVKVGKVNGKIIGLNKDKTKATILLPEGGTSLRQINLLSIDYSANYIAYAPKKESVNVPAGMPLAVDTMADALAKTKGDGKWRALLPGQDGIRYGEMIVTSAKTPSGKTVNRVNFMLTKEHRKKLRDLLEGSAEPPETGDWVNVSKKSHEVAPGDQLSMRWSSQNVWKVQPDIKPPTHTVTSIVKNADDENYTVNLTPVDGGDPITSIFQPNRDVNVYAWDPNKPKPISASSHNAFALSSAAKADGWKQLNNSDGVHSAIKGGQYGHGVLDVEPGQAVPTSMSAYQGTGSTGFGNALRLVQPDGVVIEITSMDLADNSLKGNVVITLPENAGEQDLNTALDRLGLAHKPLTQDDAKRNVTRILSSMLHYDKANIDNDQDKTPEQLFARFGESLGLTDVGWHDVLVSVEEETGKLSYYWSDRVRKTISEQAKTKLLFRGTKLDGTHTANVDMIVSNALYGTANGWLKRVGGLIHPTSTSVGAGFSPGSDVLENAGHGSFMSSSSSIKLVAQNSLATYVGSDMMVYTRAEALLYRIQDYRVSEISDAFGNPNRHNSAGIGKHNNFKTLLTPASTIRDIAAIGGIASDSTGLIAVTTNQQRVDAIKRLHQHGVTEVNGIPVEDFIVLKSSLPEKNFSDLAQVHIPDNARPLLDLPVAYEPVAMGAAA